MNRFRDEFHSLYLGKTGFYRNSDESCSETDAYNDYDDNYAETDDNM